MRRAHRKSRLGCKECKQKHKRCDESRPSCNNCLAFHRRCSYLDLVATKLPELPRPNDALPKSASLIGTSMYGDVPPNAFSVSLVGERYSLLHLELMRDYEDLGRVLGHLEPTVQLVLKQAAAEAMTTPYLMDEILAFSAAYKSTLPGDRQDSYRIESTRLQTRALSQFNAIKPSVSDENCMALFSFAAFLGQHAFFDTFSRPADIAEILDKFVQCLRLHHGIRAIAGSSWTRIEKMHPYLEPADHRHKLAKAELGAECALLVELLRASSLPASVIEICESDINLLQCMFDSQRYGLKTHGGRRFVATQEWLVRLSLDFMNLINQRRPEALVILAHYGILLHRAKDYWVVGNAGRFLVKSITSHLGSYWADWLKWPNEVLDTDTE